MYKHTSPFSQSFEEFAAAVNREISVTNQKIEILNKKGKLAERIVTRKISREKIPLIDKILNFFLHFFSKEYREAKKDIRLNLLKFRRIYLKNPQPFIPEKKSEPFPLLKLPKDMQREIFSYLDKYDVQSLIQANRKISLDAQALANLVNAHSEQFTLKELTNLPDDCRKLVSRLDLRYIEMKDEELIRLLDLYPNLKELFVHYCREITSKSFNKIAKLQNLEKLELDETESSTYIARKSFNDADMQKVSQLKKLKSLSIKGYYDVTDEGLESIHELKELRSLELPNRKIDKITIQKITQLKHLNALYLPNCELTNEELKLISEMEQLESLEFKSTKTISSEGFKSLSNLKSLKTLNVSGYYLPNSALETISKLKNLNSLKLEDHSISHDEFEKIARLENLITLTFMNYTLDPNLCFQTIAKLDHLQNLEIKMHNITEGCLEKIKHLDLKFLSLYGLDMLNYDVFTSFRNLEKLDLALSDLTDEALDKILELHHLHSLNISGSKKITDKGLKKIRALKKLKKVNLNYCKKITHLTLKNLTQLEDLQSLELFRIDLNEKELLTLSKMKKLNSLSLSTTRQTGYFSKELSIKLAFLKNLKKLKFLSLIHDSKTSDHDFAELKTAFPHLLIFRH